MIHPPVCVYNGPGANSECIEWTLAAFRSFFKDPSSVGTINESGIKSNAWMENTRILIIPGGMANPYHQELGDQGMGNIIKFVHSGRTLVGICAGAYFTAAQSNFGLGTDLEVKNTHLGLFPGEVQGPFFKDFNYFDNTIHYIHVPCDDAKLRVAYVHGGGWFVNPEQYPDISVLARYEYATCGRAAMVKIINCGEGKGVVLASHLHFECPKYWKNWRDFILNALEHEQCLVYSSEQTI